MPPKFHYRPKEKIPHALEMKTKSILLNEKEKAKVRK